MSSIDPPDRPSEKPAPIPGDESIAPPSPDLRRTPPAEGGLGAPPGWQPELEALPDRSITQQLRRPHPNFGWSCLWCFLFVLATQIPGGIIVGVLVVAMTLISPDQFPPETTTSSSALLKSPPMGVALGVGFFFTELLVIGFSLLIIRLVVGRDWTRQLALRRPSLGHTLLAVASFPALVLFGNLAYEVLRNVLHVPSFSDFGLGGMEEMVHVFSKWPWAFAVLVIGLGPGVGEELWCRGFLGRGLVGHYGVLVGVLASSFFFGLIHLDPCQGTMAMLMGLWLHFVYLTTRSLWLPMLLHFLNNSFAVLASRYPELEGIESAPGGISPLVYATSGLLLVGVAYALYQSRAQLRPERPEQLLIWRPSYPGVEYPPSDSGTRVVRPMPSLLALALVGAGILAFAIACLGAIRVV